MPTARTKSKALPRADFPEQVGVSSKAISELLDDFERSGIELHSIMILRHGKEGEIYNVGGHNEMKNIDIVKLICRELGKPEELITYVEDRKGHDRRYAIDPSKIHRELGWLPETSFAEGIKKTINWYLNHQEWWRPIVEKEMKIKC